MAKRIGVIGTGYVGSVVGACLAETGNKVICGDIDEKKIQGYKLSAEDLGNPIPIHEPGLQQIIFNTSKSRNLAFTTDLKNLVKESEIIFNAVGTPSNEDGSINLEYVESVARAIGQYINYYKIIVNKSTVPPGTQEKVTEIIQAEISERNLEIKFDVVSNPEFLKEGTAVEDFQKPDRIIIGSNSTIAIKTMKEIYAPYVLSGNPLLTMSPIEAEVVKYSANIMLAGKISFSNEIANLCRSAGADYRMVQKGFTSDSRIGSDFTNAGVGYGGSCFKKDVQEAVHFAKKNGIEIPLIEQIHLTNETQKVHLAKLIEEYYEGSLEEKTFGIWGLSFKPNTDDTRGAPSITIINYLLEKGAAIKAYDPQAKLDFSNPKYSQVNDIYTAIKDTHGLVLVTEWNDFRSPDWSIIEGIMANPVIFDGKIIYNNIDELTCLGFDYVAIGRPTHKAQ